MNSLRILLLFAAILSLPCTSYAQWANKPASATTIFDCAFTDNLCNLQNFYNTQGYASPGGAGAPLSPPRAFDTFLGVGSEYGNGQWGLSVPNAKEIYMGAWWSTNANFVGMSGGHNKMLQFGSAADGDNSFMFWTGAAGNLGSITWFNQTSSSNAHVAGWSGDANGLSGVIYGNCPNVPPGSGWHLLEVYQKSSSTMTSRDGILRVWVDGAMCINVTNINKSPSGTSSWQINHAWDGSAGVACTYNGGTRDCSKRWDHYWDHIIVAVGGGGGTTPPPPSPTPPSPTPPPPSGPPGTVSDLAVVPQSSTTALVSFSAVDDGTGTPAKYDNRLAPAPINWGATSGIASGACASPFAPSVIIGSTVTCLLTGLTPGQSYQLQNVAFRGTMNAGAIYGSLSNVASFTMPSSNVPSITNFTPASGATGVSVTITGSNFGATVGGNTVKFNGQTATVTAASSTSLTVTAPDGVTTGKVSVQTDQGIVYSEQNFTVGGESSSCGCS